MSRYIKMNLTIELDDDIDEKTLEELYEFQRRLRIVLFCFFAVVYSYSNTLFSLPYYN